MRQFLLGLGLLLVGVATQAATPVSVPMNFFWIAHGPLAASHPGQLYGPSDPSGQWGAFQWGTNPPATDMTPFAPVNCSQVVTRAANQPISNCFQAAGPIQIMTQFTSGGAVFLQMQSTGIMQPCYTTGNPGGNPYEHDTFISPLSTGNYPGFPSGILAQPGLGTLSHLVMTFTLSVKYIAQNVQGGCPPQGAAGVQALQILVSPTFGNSTAGQTLFYQLAVGKAGTSVFSNAAQGYFANTNPYGYSDDVASYGLSSQIGAFNTPITYTLDMLPRIQTILNAGSGFSVPVDNNIAHWSVGGFYMGHIIYGNIGAITEWSNISYVGS